MKSKEVPFSKIQKALTDQAYYTRVSNHLIKNPDISLAAKGLFQFLLYKMKVMAIRDISQSLKISEKTVNKYLMELAQFGFLLLKNNATGLRCNYIFNPNSKSWGLKLWEKVPQTEKKKLPQNCGKKSHSNVGKNPTTDESNLICKESFNNINKEENNGLAFIGQPFFFGLEISPGKLSSERIHEVLGPLVRSQQRDHQSQTQRQMNQKRNIILTL